MDEHVGAARQGVGHREVGRVLEIQHDRPLVAVDGQVVGAGVAAHGR